MKSYQIIAQIIFAVLLFCGCDSVHEFPETHEPEEEYIVELSFLMTDAELNNHKVITRALSGTTYSKRSIVEIHYKGQVILKEQVVRHTESDEEIKFRFTLPLREEFQVLAWHDYILANDTADLFYQTQKLDEVVLSDSYYYTHTNERDVHTGNLTFTTHPQDFDEDGVARKTVELNRPLAKFQIITTDLQKYYEKSNKKPHSVKLVYENDLPLYYCSSKKTILEYRNDYTVTGIIRDFAEHECTLVSDWVFALDYETMVDVSFEVYDDENNLLVKSPLIQIPVLRNSLTIVKDAFLTTPFNEGIGIDDKFDDHIDINL